MSNYITTKRSPIVPLRMFLAIEVAAIILYLFATTINELKFQIYTALPISSIISYQAFKFPFLSSVQFIITVYVFLRWYYESYTIKHDSISHSWGVLFKRKKSVPLGAKTNISISSGVVGKLLHYGTIYVTGSDKRAEATLRDISRPHEVGSFIERRGVSEKAIIRPDISRLIKENEHERLEFKASLRFDHRTAKVNNELELAAMKTVAAFLNSNGGHLVIGIADDKKPIGLHHDYRTLKRKDGDGFENHFTQLFNSMIGPEFRDLVKLWFDKEDEVDVCALSVAPSHSPVYLTYDNKEHFYIRTGNTTTPLQFKGVNRYIRNRWQSEEA